jgi:hypothetical protein
MKCAGIYVRLDRIFVHPWSRIADGGLVATEPVIGLDLSSDDGSIGEAIRTALNASKSSIPPPKDWKALVRPLLDISGTKSWSQFVKRSKYCEVLESDMGMTITPFRLREDARGFDPCGEEKVEVSIDADAVSLGRMFREALAAC